MTAQILNEDMPQMQSKRVAIMVGRFQPPTIGHYKVINEMVDAIRKHNHNNKNDRLETTPVVAIITGKKTSLDTTRNPLSSDEVEKIMRASGQIDSKTIFIHGSSLMSAFVETRRKGYEPIMVFGGDDRGTKGEAPYKDLLDKYFLDAQDKPIKHEYVSISRNNAADLDDKSQDTLLDMIEKDGEVDAAVVSGTLARRAAKRDLYNAFATIVGLKKKNEIAKIAFRKVKAGAK